MKYAIKVLNPGKSHVNLGDGKYITSTFGDTSNNLEDALTYRKVSGVETALLKMNQYNIERKKGKWGMNDLPDLHIIQVELVETTI